MRGDSLEAWERQLRHTCGACGMRSLIRHAGAQSTDPPTHPLSVDPRCCDLVGELTACPFCGAVKSPDAAVRNRTWPMPAEGARA